MRLHPLSFSSTRRVPLALGAAFLLVATSPLASPVAAQVDDHPAADASELGSVDFDVSCDPAVRDDFDRAVALLHHMMYEESRGAFDEIARRDPECAMARWGIATTLFQPLWPARPDAEARRRGWEAVREARALGSGSEREDALLAATGAFFRDPAADEWWPRIERWAEAMEEAYREWPDDDDVAAFYALSVLAAGQTAEDQLAHNARAAEILGEVHERNPRHPGAIHYTIHADDAGGRASENLSVVESYGEIAPSVPHALHMPTHIYVRLGDWREVIEWNRRSADAALERTAGDRVSLHHVHALDYLLYAHLQRGEDERAAEVLRDQLGGVDRRYQEDFISAFHLAVIPARYALERRAWDEAARITPREPGYLQWDRYLWPEALSWFARGLGAVHSGDLAGAREAEARMDELRRRARDAGEGRFATYIDVDRLILSGWIAHAEGESRVAVERIREATELEGTVEKHPVTPGALLPPYEALGDLLMELDRPAEALSAYQASLEIWPGRYHSVLGAARAARASGDDDLARERYAALLEVVGDADSPRPGVREAEAAVR